MLEDWTTPLLALQQIDDKLRRLKTRLTLIPNELQALKQHAAANRAGQKAVEDDLRAIELRIRRNENAVAEIRDAILKLRQQSGMVKKNTEYQAMLLQIAENEKRIDALEADSIEALDQTELRKVDLRTISAENDAANAALKTEFGELQNLASELKQEIARLEAKRPERTAPLPQELLGIYQTLLDRDPGLPLIKAIDGICENCHLRLTPQTLTNAKKGQVVRCDNCMHLIYL